MTTGPQENPDRRASQPLSSHPVVTGAADGWSGATAPNQFAFSSGAHPVSAFSAVLSGLQDGGSRGGWRQPPLTSSGSGRTVTTAIAPPNKPQPAPANSHSDGQYATQHNQLSPSGMGAMDLMAQLCGALPPGAEGAAMARMLLGLDQHGGGAFSGAISQQPASANGGAPASLQLPHGVPATDLHVQLNHAAKPAPGSNISQEQRGSPGGAANGNAGAVKAEDQADGHASHHRPHRGQQSFQSIPEGVEGGEWEPDRGDKEDAEATDPGGSSGQDARRQQRGAQAPLPPIGRPLTYQGSDPDSDPNLNEEERRREKRRSANRESARRVRQKRQELLDELNQKCTLLTQQNARLLSHAAAVEQRRLALSNLMGLLRERYSAKAAEAEHLQAESQALRKALEERGVPVDELLQAAHVPQPPPLSGASADASAGLFAGPVSGAGGFQTLPASVLQGVVGALAPSAFAPVGISMGSLAGGGQLERGLLPALFGGGSG